LLLLLEPLLRQLLSQTSLLLPLLQGLTLLAWL
jgi:hypothetical protein